MSSLFSGVTILDFTRVFSGPLATLTFAQWGAHVIKIEPPRGDDTRCYPPKIGEWSGYFEMLNHNKTARVVDLKTTAGQQEIIRLIPTVDVLVENFAPGVTRQFGIDYASLVQLNPRLIYASLVGIDATTDRKYYDVIAQAESGVMSLIGQGAEPIKIGPAIVDAFAGMNLAFSVAAALYYREKTGQGQAITVSMLASAMPLLEQNLTAASLTGINPRPCGNYDTAIAPFGIYATANGSVVIAAGNDHLWQRLADWLKWYEPLPLNQFATNTLRLENQSALNDAIELVTRQMPRQQVLDELSARGIPCGPVRSMMDVLAEPWFYQQALQIVQPKDGITCVIPGTSFSSSQLQPEPYCPADPLSIANDSFETLPTTA